MKPQSLLDRFLLNISISAIESPKEFDGDIVHYTSINSLGSILQKQGDTFTLWASRYDCLNDITEGTVVEQRYAEACDSLFAEGLLSEEQYQLFKSIRATRNETFMVSQNGTLHPTRCECDIYVTSFSKGRDLLAMWNYYSKGTKYEGCNIGLSTKEAITTLKNAFADGKVNIQVCPVIYSAEEQSQTIRKMILELARKHEKSYEPCIRAIVSMRLMALKMTFKLEHFQHEQEVRIIVKVARKYKNEIPVKYRAYGGLLIPYIELPIPKNAVKFVTLGPIQGDTTQKELQTNVLSEMMLEFGYSADSLCSQIPVRY